MEAMWMRSLLGEIGYPQEGATTIYMDNQSTIQVAKNHTWANEAHGFAVPLA